MTASPDPLSKHLPPRLTRERVDRQWGAIDARARPRGARRAGLWAGVAVGGVALAAAALLLLRRPPTTATLVDGTWLESAPSGPSPAVTLADGSHVSLGARSRLRLTSTRADAVRLDLESGRVAVQATHVTGRTFVVVAHDVEVRVVGTRFEVEADGPVRVHVDEGRVHVVDPAGERDVSGGEEWVAGPTLPASASPSASASASASASTTAPASASSDEPSPRAPAPRPPPPSAKDLLDGAQRAMAQGQSREAAKAFDALRRDYPRDARAGLAAFELGRLRLDALGDPSGADEAFRDAMRRAREPGLRDDSEAGHVEALDRAGAHDACARARDAYLTHWPSGVHRGEVARRCGGS
jgi:hypothetical protein